MNCTGNVVIIHQYHIYLDVFLERFEKDLEQERGGHVMVLRPEVVEWTFFSSPSSKCPGLGCARVFLKGRKIQTHKYNAGKIIRFFSYAI